MPQEMPAALPRETPVVSSPTVPPVAPMLTIEPMKLEAPASAEPEPAQAAGIALSALSPEAASDLPAVPSPLVFETPRPDFIPPLAEMPKLEPVAPPPVTAPAKPGATPAPAEQAKPAQPPKPAEQAKAVELAATELPKTVSVLPPPKPPLSPAQRLDLQGKDYDKAEKCLAQAVYFEARDQALRGQQAVAQVVLNRVFSPHYPKDICSVVFQNAHRHLSCQFTFACDGKPETIRERGAWARASRIAKQTLNAQVWLPEVDKATHYHASYVHPRWVRDMKVMVRYGIHTFYRPRNWGDGANEPHWGTAANSAKPAATMAAVSTKHHAAPAAKRALLRRTASLR
jgi:spore germination cell wall hydrolase CwlJ-like protein